MGSKSIILILSVLALVACNPAYTGNFTNFSLTNISNVTNESAAVAQPVSQPQEFAAKLNYTEGDLIKLSPVVSSPDKAQITVTFSLPFDSKGVWQTKVGDAGDYPVTITATDSRGLSSAERILVSIKYANRPPVLDCPDAVSGKEGDTVNIDCKASDPDNDQVVLSFTGWMKSNTYTTAFGDAGTHTVSVTADDGKLTTKKDITVSITKTNRPPVITVQDSYTTDELTPVTIKAKATSPDGNKVTISYSTPFDDTGTWTPAYGQAGDYQVTITATDGITTSTKTVLVHVGKTDRPPVIAVLSSDGIVHYKEGDYVDLTKSLSITEPENETFTVTSSGWMNSATYLSGYSDSGNHTVTVTATDASGHTAKQDVTVEVQDVNRAPVFTKPA